MPRWLKKTRRRMMRSTLFKYVLAVILLLIILPGAVLLFFPGDSSVEIEGDENKVQLYVKEEGQVREMGLEEYVVGVVAAEMPASFPLEALKAQAVAARTYAVKRLQVPDPRVKKLDPRADLSSDHTINQAWISSEEMRKRWGKWNFKKYQSKIIQAVRETKDIVIVYEGKLIDPLYHASCGGVGTANSEDVWQMEIPYLRSVSCNNHPNHNKEEVKVFNLQDLPNLLGRGNKALPVGGIFNRDVLKVQEKTSNGRIKTLSFNGETLRGSELRSKLDLKSTIAQWEIRGNQLTVKTRGYGHGVGMCQYGAGALAGEGKSYKEILSHYYTDVKYARIKRK